jgi:carbamoyl-phosphate synthase large subunit
VRPQFKRIDSCAAEFRATTPYMYSTYEFGALRQAMSPIAKPIRADRNKIIILGGGPNRIGQGIEFDYCCCHAAFACARSASNRSWSTATRKPCRRITTPPTASISSR